MKPNFAPYGFAHQKNLIMAYIGGSEAHDAKLGATDDTDWYGRYIPPPELILGRDREEHFVLSTGGEIGGNGPQDVDVCRYTLMRWAGLAAEGQSFGSPFPFRAAQVHHHNVGSSRRPSATFSRQEPPPTFSRFSQTIR
jgi:hypothetical protein